MRIAGARQVFVLDGLLHFLGFAPSLANVLDDEVRDLSTTLRESLKPSFARKNIAQPCVPRVGSGTPGRIGSHAPKLMVYTIYPHPQSNKKLLVAEV